jgi:outer membrane immunogenic protein
VALAAMIASPAMAADMPVKALPPPAPVFYDWSGAYIGFNYGHMWYDVDRHFLNPIPGGPFEGRLLGDFTTDDSDHIFGFHAGAQWQWGQIVFGIEAALSGCFEECRTVTDPLPPPFNPNIAGEHKITNLFTIGPRLGWAWDRWLLFATGGAASANLKATYCNAFVDLCGPNPDNPLAVQHGQTWNWGWYVGGGFEYMIYRGPLVDVVFGTEVQYWDVDAEEGFRCTNPGPALTGCGPLPSFRDYDLSANGFLFRSRLTIKTQGWGIWGKAPVAPAVMAKY